MGVGSGAPPASVVDGLVEAVCDDDDDAVALVEVDPKVDGVSTDEGMKGEDETEGDTVGVNVAVAANELLTEGDGNWYPAESEAEAVLLVVLLAVCEELGVELTVVLSVGVELIVVLSVGELDMVVLSLAVWLLVVLQLAVALGDADTVTDSEGVSDSPDVGDTEADATTDGVLLNDIELLAVDEALLDGDVEREAATEALTDREAVTEGVIVTEAVREAETVGEGATLCVGVRLRPLVGEMLDEMLCVGVYEAVPVCEGEAVIEVDAEEDGETDSVGDPIETKM